MDHALGMGVIQRQQDLRHDFPHLPDGNERACLDHVFERAGVDIFHYDIRSPLVLHEVEHRDDIGVQTARRRFRLGDEAFEEALGIDDVVEDFRTQSLDGERPVDLLVITLVDNANRTASDHVIDAILPNPLENYVAFHCAPSLCRASARNETVHLSRYFIAKSRLRRILLKERDKDATSSEPAYSNSGIDVSPML